MHVTIHLISVVVEDDIEVSFDISSKKKLLDIPLVKKSVSDA